MKLPVKVLLFCFVVAGAWWWSTYPAKAEDFQAAYQIDYALNTETSLTHVTQRVTLTNLAPNLRASSYSLTLDKGGYQNLNARDSGGQLAVAETVDEQGIPTITFTFNDRVVGVGNRLSWTIEYDSPTLIQKRGQIWDVSIPRVKESQSYNIDTYTARLILPTSVGPAAYVSPGPSSTAHTDEHFTFVFDKDLVVPTGIVAAFGQAQVFRFDLTYHLKNPNIGQASTEIALPADIPGYQQIIYDQLEPQPVSLRSDADGNTLATYHLKSRQELDVRFLGWAKIQPGPRVLDSPKTAEALPAELVSAYTRSQPFWETSDPEIVAKTKEITDASKPVVANARAIYQYVTDTLEYNTARINKDLQRMGASAAFRDTQNAVCMEFTDLFVTMARIAGIPAREIDGYAYTADTSNQPIFYPGLGSDILHAWAQIYLPDAGWVMVDPTWGSTTNGVDYFGRIDLDRIGFAIKGISSQTPYAAGSYKTNDQQDGDVKVAFSSEHIAGQPAVSLSLADQLVISGFGSSLPIMVTNRGNAAIHNLNLTFSTGQPVSLADDASKQLAILLPTQTQEIDLSVTTAGWLHHTNTDIMVKATGADVMSTPVTTDQTLTMEVRPFFRALLQPVMVMVMMFGAAIFAVWFSLQRWYDRQRDKRSAGTVVTDDQSSPVGSQPSQS